MVEKTGMQEHPTVQAKEFLERHHPEAKEWFDTFLPSGKTYLSDLKMAMETEEFVFRDFNKLRDSFWYAGTVGFDAVSG